MRPAERVQVPRFVSVRKMTAKGQACDRAILAVSLGLMKPRTQSGRSTKAAIGLRGVLALLAVSVAGAAGAQDIRTTVDGYLVNFPDVQPIMVNGRVMVPVRGVFEHMNATVTWDSYNQTVNATRGTDTISLPVNSYTATVNGRTVNLDTPATMRSGRVLVPLRFLSESLGAEVEWLSATRTVEITNAGSTPPYEPGYTTMMINSDTVVPFKLNQRMTSNESSQGDRFTASLDTNGFSNYQGLPAGSILEGHVDVVRAKTGDTPGVLGLKFDRVRLPDGTTYPIYGALIGLDKDSVTNENGRLVAKDGAKDNNLKYVGYGAGAGALVAILTDGNILTNSLIGGALGFLFGEIQKDPSKSRNVVLDANTKFGVRLTNDFSFRVANTR